MIGQQREARHGLLMALEGIPAGRPVAVPDPDGGVVGARHDHVLRPLVAKARLCGVGHRFWG